MPLLAVTVLHASNFAVGALVAAAYLPWLLVGLPAGAWIDQLPARPVMITCDVVSAVLFLSIPVSAWAGILTLGQVMVVAFLAGTASVFSVTAGQVYMPALITRAELMEGNAKLQGSESAAELAGPGVAGLVAQTLGVSAALVGNALSFLVSAACVLGTRPRSAERPSPAEQPSPADQSPARRPRLRQTIADGLRFVARDPFLARMSLSSTVGNLALSGFQAVQIVFLVRVLKLPPLAVGLLVAVPGVGALFGALSARRISERIGTARGLLLAFSCAQPFCLLAPLATRGAGVVLYVAGMLIFPVGVAVANVIIASFRQAYTPPGMLGRVSATMKFLAYGGIPLGALAGGGLAATLGPRQALWIIFAVLTGSGVLVFSRPFFQYRDLPASQDNAASAGSRGAGTRPQTGKRRKQAQTAHEQATRTISP
jgi:Na+/melibiose symporter-like transporter